MVFSLTWKWKNNNIAHATAAQNFETQLNNSRPAAAACIILNDKRENIRIVIYIHTYYTYIIIIIIICTYVVFLLIHTNKTPTGRQSETTRRVRFVRNVRSAVCIVFYTIINTILL